MKTRFQRWFVLVLFASLVLALGSTSMAGQAVPGVLGASDLAVASYSASPNYTGCGGEPGVIVNTAFEQEIVELVNTERANRSLPPLKRRDVLENAARYYATDMGQDDYYAPDPSKAHDTYDRVSGVITWVCSTGSRLAIYYPNALSWAENMAQGYLTPQDVMNGWMGSTHHRDNILSTSNWEIGVGYYDLGGSQAPYWVQDFGRQWGVYPVIINGEAAETSSRTVSLYIYGSGDWADMRFSTDGGSTWSNWESFNSNKSLDLPDAKGQHTVCVELRQGGQTTQSCDTITLTGGGDSPPTVAITAPSDGSTFTPGSTVNLTGTATDPEDGDISAGISWSSSRDGALGTGASISVVLSAGTHTITAQVTDSGNNTRSDTINVTVGPVQAGDNYVFLPIVLRNYRTGVVGGWTTIVQEDFEGGFPGAWELSSQGQASGEYYWGQRSCRSYAGSYSGWAVGGGATGSGLGCGANYPDNVKSWMIYGPFSLADATAAEFNFQLWINSQSDYYDYVYVGASIDDLSYYGDPISGDSQGWIDWSLDLSAVPTLGDLRGQSQVWVALVFSSDASINYAEGAYVDNIVVRKYVSATGQSPPVEPGGEMDTLGQGEAGLVETEVHIQR